jgi:kinesin family protein 22
MALTDKEIDERISKAVEMEVARRLQEREHERAKEEDERRAKQHEPTASSEKVVPAAEDPSQTLPSGVLTPLLQRHRDLDEELKARLRELENKFERGNKEVQLADALSPVSKKKTGRAYVALARAHSEKGDLQVALDLYRKAENYVPDNVKLKERIIEIEWAVKHDKEFVPSPKRPKKTKSKKRGKNASGSGLKVELVEPTITTVDVKMEVDEGSDKTDVKSSLVKPTNKGKRKKNAQFGSEATNKPDEAEEDEDMETPSKRQRLGEHVGNEAWTPPGLTKKLKRRTVAAAE